jgi:hypothetical protein
MPLIGICTRAVIGAVDCLNDGIEWRRGATAGPKLAAPTPDPRRMRLIEQMGHMGERTAGRNIFL